MDKALLRLVVIFYAIVTVSLTLAAEADVRLITYPKGPHIRALVGKPFNISCEGIGDEESKFSSMKWQDPAGSLITERNIPGVMKSGNKLFLSILNPEFYDSGSYNCSALYNNKTNLQYSIYLEFYNLEPQFSYHFSNFTVRENASLEVYCFARGQPPITYNWYNLEGDRIPENENRAIFVSNSENRSSLKIPKVKMMNKGIYMCTASNTFGTASLMYAITVFNDQDVVPSFILPFENVTAKEGTKLILRCAAQGAKPMQYTWYNQKEDIISENANLPIFVSNFEDYSLLTFENLRIGDEGTYTCTASNMYGLESKMYSLQVTTSNESDINNGTSQFRNAKVVNVSANSVDFHVATSGSVKYIEVKYSENRVTTVRNRRFIPVPGNIYRITDLIPSGLYNFQFRTTPSEGDEWSKAYQVTMLPDRPDIIFQSMNTNSVTLAWARSTDEIFRQAIDSHEIKYFRVDTQGNSWKASDCAVTIQVPACMNTKYTISGLTPMMHYQIEVRAHTAAGYGEANRQKVYLTR